MALVVLHPVVTAKELAVMLLSLDPSTVLAVAAAVPWPVATLPPTAKTEAAEVAAGQRRSPILLVLGHQDRVTQVEQGRPLLVVDVVVAVVAQVR